jgi:aryl-alcohol dehydrogenase-like predicted oxidoreductase
MVGRLGLASSYGAPAPAFEWAFERGCNLFYWGSLRKAGMAAAIRNLAPRNRDRMVVMLQSYSRYGLRLPRVLAAGLRDLKLEYADILLLGWQNTEASRRLLDVAWREVEQGRVRHLAVSFHDRSAFRVHLAEQRIGALMFRYNAAHRAAETTVFPNLPAPGANGPGIITFTAQRWGTLINPRFTPAGERPPTGGDCYRYVLSQPQVDVCLTGPATTAQMEEAVGALATGPMTADELQWMQRVGDGVHRQTCRSWSNPFMQREQ